MAHLFGNLQWQALATGSGDDCRRHDMLRGLLKRGREPERFIWVFAGSSFDGDQSRSANRESARLIEHHSVRSRERLERPAAFDQDAPASRLGGPSDEGHGRPRLSVSSDLSCHNLRGGCARRILED
jgi:hypothetical protein